MDAKTAPQGVTIAREFTELLTGEKAAKLAVSQDLDQRDAIEAEGHLRRVDVIAGRRRAVAAKALPVGQQPAQDGI